MTVYELIKLLEQVQDKNAPVQLYHDLHLSPLRLVKDTPHINSVVIFAGK